MPIRFCTLTGVDTRTDRTWVVTASSIFPFVEWGVLYSPDRAGKENRYPELSFARDFAVFANGLQLNTAIHLCGKAVTDLLALANGRLSGDEDLAARDLLRVAQSYGRVQLNNFIGSKAAEYPPLVELLRSVDPDLRVIVAYFKSNAPACRTLAAENVPGLDFLVDSSGGRGKQPDAWPTLADLPPEFAERSVAFAGGMGADNTAAQLALIAPIVRPGHRYGIDMETRIRDDEDWLCPVRCRSVLEQVHHFEIAAMTAGLEATATLKAPLLPSRLEELSGLVLDFMVAIKLGHRPVPLQAGDVALHVLDRRSDSLEPLRVSANQVARELNLRAVCTAPGQWAVTQGIRRVPVPARSRDQAILRGVVALELESGV